jgi:hypothetical protein
MTAQVFTVPDRSIPSTYDRKEDLSTTYVLGPGLQKRINRELLLDEENAKRTAELTSLGLSSGKGFYANEVIVTGD